MIQYRNEDISAYSSPLNGRLSASLTLVACGGVGSSSDDGIVAAAGTTTEPNPDASFNKNQAVNFCRLYAC